MSIVEHAPLLAPRVDACARPAAPGGGAGGRGAAGEPEAPARAELALRALDALDLGVVVTDRALRVVLYVNPAAQAVLATFAGPPRRLPPQVRRVLPAARALAAAAPPRFCAPAAVATPNGQRYLVRGRICAGDAALAVVTFSRAMAHAREVPARLVAELGLTRQQCDIIAGVREGLRNEEIGRRLRLSLATVKSYLNEIFTALQVRNRAALVAVVDDLLAEGEPAAPPRAGR